jgi:hypothetical protein
MFINEGKNETQQRKAVNYLAAVKEYGEGT